MYGMTWTWIQHGMGPAILTSPWVIATSYILATFLIIQLRKEKLVPFINEVHYIQYPIYIMFSTQFTSYSVPTLHHTWDLLRLCRCL